MDCKIQVLKSNHQYALTRAFNKSEVTKSELLHCLKHLFSFSPC